MKILFILELFKPHIGGVEILFDNLIKGLIGQGHQVTILTSRFDKKLEKHEKLENGVEVYRVGSNRYNFMRFCIRKGIKLAKQHDVIHTTTYNAAIPASIIGRISRRKVVITVHEIFGKLRYKFKGCSGLFYNIFENLIFRFSFDKYICVSNYTKNCLRVKYGIADKKLVTIYNGIDYSLWDKDSFKQENIDEIKEKYNLKNFYTGLFFGRAGISKGLYVYLQAIPEIIKKIPNFKAFLIVSESGNNSAVRERKIIDELNINKYIIWLPGVKYDVLGDYIIASDVVVVPSLAEGFGFSAAETCALGQQLVVSDVASLPEVVSGKINFVEPGNSSDIAQKIIQFHKGKYENIPEKKFFRKDNIKKTLEVYGGLLSK